MTAESHAYISTACHHGECGSCRNTCKYCGAPCGHDCHPQDGRALPPSWTDQARGLAARLYEHAASTGVLPPELLRRIGTDPDLFWLRGEVQPPGQWHPRERG